jgi:hypothetical protein
MSIGVWITDEAYNMLGFEQMRFRPPAGTVIEIPIPEHQNANIPGKTIQEYRDVFTGEIVPVVSDRFLVTARAAEVNGYVMLDSNKLWLPLTYPPEWHRDAVTYDIGEQRIRAKIDELFGNGKPDAVIAHNAPFDNGFVAQYLPNLYTRISQPEKKWTCSMQLLRAWRKKTGIDGKATLDELSKLAGYNPPRDTHEALDDTIRCAVGYQWLMSGLPPVATA